MMRRASSGGNTLYRDPGLPGYKAVHKRQEHLPYMLQILHLPYLGDTSTDFGEV